MFDKICYFSICILLDLYIICIECNDHDITFPYSSEVWRSFTCPPHCVSCFVQPDPLQFRGLQFSYWQCIFNVWEPFFKWRRKSSWLNNTLWQLRAAILPFLFYRRRWLFSTPLFRSLNTAVDWESSALSISPVLFSPHWVTVLMLLAHSVFAMSVERYLVLLERVGICFYTFNYFVHHRAIVLRNVLLQHVLQLFLWSLPHTDVLGSNEIPYRVADVHLLEQLCTTAIGYAAIQSPTNVSNTKEYWPPELHQLNRALARLDMMILVSKAF